MKSFGLFAVTLLFPFSVFAQSEPDYEALFKNLQRLQQEIKQSAQTAPTCKIMPLEKCTFDEYCQKLRGQSQNFYLYKNKDGKKVPNFFFIRLANQVRGCLDQPLPEIDTQDPFVNPLKLTKANPSYQAELARTQKIFADVQAHAVAMLESRKTADNAKEIDQEIKRIKAIKMTSPVFKDQFAVEKANCVLPGASYQSSDNSILLCPQMLNMPDATLFSTLAHELSHSIDPCNAYQEIADTKISVGKNPMQGVIACLQKPSSLEAVAFSEKNLLDAITKEQDQLAKDLGPLSAEVKAAFQKKKQAIAAGFKTNQYCRNFSKNSDMQEGFADWMSSKILARKISEMKDGEKAKAYAFESQLMIASADCKNIQIAAIGRIAEAVKQDCPVFGQSSLDFMLNPEAYADPEEVPHPKSSRRINKILFAPSEIQKALACSGSNKINTCE